MLSELLDPREILDHRVHQSARLNRDLLFLGHINAAEANRRIDGDPSIDGGVVVGSLVHDWASFDQHCHIERHDACDGDAEDPDSGCNCWRHAPYDNPATEGDPGAVAVTYADWQPTA